MSSVLSNAVFCAPRGGNLRAYARDLAEEVLFNESPSDRALIYSFLDPFRLAPRAQVWARTRAYSFWWGVVEQGLPVYREELDDFMLTPSEVDAIEIDLFVEARDASRFHCRL